MADVIVVGFEVNDIERDSEIRRPIKATRELLRQIKGAVEIPGTEETVHESDLDDRGFYQSKP